MGYAEFAAPPELRHAIECLWVRRGDAQVRVLPDGCVDLVWEADVGATLAGPDTGPRLVELEPERVSVGIRFLPGAGGAALGLPLSEVRDLHPQLGDLLPALERELPPSLPPREAMRTLAAIAARLVDQGRPDPFVRRASVELERDPRANIEQMADQLGLGERQLRRRFQTSVGYGPKTLQRVLRFRRLVARLQSDGDAQLAALAAELGYADQAHLTRETTRLAGMTPSQLAKKR